MKGKEIVRGSVGNPGIAVVTVRLVGISDVAKMATMKHGEVWVTKRFDDTAYDKYLAQISALVTDFGGETAHGALLARRMVAEAKEKGIQMILPVVTGTIEATSILKEGQKVVVDGKAGVDADTGRPYGAVYEYVPDQPAASAGATLADRIAMMMAKVAANQGKPIPPELLEKQKKLG